MVRITILTIMLLILIGASIVPTISGKVEQNIIDNINSTSHIAIDTFNKSISSFFKGDIKAADDVIESVKKLEQRCNKINTLAIQQKGTIVVSFGYIVESIRRIGEYAEDISEHVINYLTDEGI